MEHYPNKCQFNKLVHFKDTKTEKVFPKADSACPFRNSKLSRIFTKSFYYEGKKEFTECKRYKSQNEVNNESNSPVKRKSNSILSFLEKRRSSD